MVGYTETLTDPSYSGQILCLTYPLIGNYGVPDKEIKDEFGLPKFFESDKIQVRGLIIHDLSIVASHWSCVKTLDQWLYEERIPGIYGIDTRELTKILRVKGVMKGAMWVSDNIKEKEGEDSYSIEGTRRLNELIKNEKYDGQNFMSEVSVSEPHEYGDKNRDRIVLLDTGTKYSIIRNIIKTGFSVISVPWDTSYEKIMSYQPKGIVISNGPGDPKICNATIKTATKLIETSIPTLGICLGNQILALAGGADTYKLKFGHRGQNKPCIDVRNKRAYITSQNHGYGIDPDTLNNSDFKIWFSNADDDTVEGIEHQSKPILAVQFHPEASPGPYDCMFVFDRFKQIIDAFKKQTSLSTVKGSVNSGNKNTITAKTAKKRSKKKKDIKHGIIKRRKIAKG